MCEARRNRAGATGGGVGCTLSVSGITIARPACDTALLGTREQMT